MSLMLRASRSLPLKLVAGEYEKILRRRLVMVGAAMLLPRDLNMCFYHVQYIEILIARKELLLAVAPS